MPTKTYFESSTPSTDASNFEPLSAHLRTALKEMMKKSFQALTSSIWHKYDR